MKTRAIILLISILNLFYGFSQSVNRYNKFSIEPSIGMAYILSDVPDSVNPRKISPYSHSLSIRYMHDDFIGISLSGHIDFFVSKLSKNNPLYYNNTNNNYTLLADLNVGKMINVNKINERLSLLVQVGGGLASLKQRKSIWFHDANSNRADDRLVFIFGLIPQYRLTDRIAIQAHLTFNTHLFQNSTYDLGKRHLEILELNGHTANFRAGGSYYLGPNKKHIDWKPKGEKMGAIDYDKPRREKSIKSDSLLAQYFDKDGDGVLDSLDFCPEVKGLAAFNGCPESYANNPYNSKNLPIIIFNPSSVELTPNDLLTLDTIADYLKQNPAIRLNVNGYSDNIGSKDEITDIANRRAINVKTELAKRGVAASHLIVKSKGSEKAEIPAEYANKLDHNRVVTFENATITSLDITDIETGEALKGLFYTIQVGVYRTALNDLEKFKPYGRLLITNTPGGYIRYSIGVIGSKKEAYTLMNKLFDEKVSKDAFVTAYYQGKKVTLSQADNLAKKGTPMQK